MSPDRLSLVGPGWTTDGCVVLVPTEPESPFACRGLGLVPFEITMNVDTVGRGPTAVSDMKARIAALKAQGEDVIEVLWERSRQAALGDGYVYEFADEAAEQVRPARHGGR